jgi:hypothetical protein
MTASLGYLKYCDFDEEEVVYADHFEANVKPLQKVKSQRNQSDRVESTSLF